MIKVGDQVRIGDFSCCVCSNNYAGVGYGCHETGAKGIFTVSHVDMKLPSYPLFYDDVRYNDTVLVGAEDATLVLFTQAQFLYKVNPTITKYKVLYSGDIIRVSISDAFYMDLKEFKIFFPELNPIYLILETAKEFDA